MKTEVFTTHNGTRGEIKPLPRGGFDLRCYHFIDGREVCFFCYGKTGTPIGEVRARARQVIAEKGGLDTTLPCTLGRVIEAQLQAGDLSFL